VNILAAPVYADSEKTRVASLLNSIALTIMVASVLIALWTLTVYVGEDTPDAWFTIAGGAVLALMSAGLLFLLRRGYTGAVGATIAGIIWMIVTLWLFTSEGIRDNSVTGYFLAITIAGLVLGSRGGAVVGLASVLAGAGAYLAETHGLITAEVRDVHPFDLLLLVTSTGIMVLLLRHASRSTAEAFERVRQQADAMAESNRQLGQEIAERVHAEEELRQSEERLRTVFENSPIGIVVVAPDTRLVEVNPAFCVMLSYTQAELLDRPIVEITHEQDLGPAAKMMQGVVADGLKDVQLEVRLVRRTGELVWCSMSGTMLESQAGGPSYGLAVVEDITERKRAEKEMRGQQEHLEELVRARTAELARSNAELERFAYVASHDLQEPLRKIQVFGERLHAGHAATLEAEGHDYLERMQDAARRGQAMVSSLLEYSRVTTSGQPFSLVSLSRVAEEVVSDLEVLIEQTGGQVQIDELPTIHADPGQMHQLLQNLIGNGLKFHRPESAPAVALEAREDSDGQVQILVRDNGIGFDETDLDQIFRPFQRLHGQGEYEGTGIGLAICHKIVERHGGTITAESVPGQGSTFIVTLPCEQPTGGNENE
jgi:PAS domain S-box-containing protein